MCNEEYRSHFIKRYGSCLINALVWTLGDLKSKDSHNLLFELLHSIDLLLGLDAAWPDEFNGEDSISFMIDQYRGFDEVEKLQNHANEDIHDKAR